VGIVVTVLGWASSVVTEELALRSISAALVLDGDLVGGHPLACVL